jgi:laccase
LFFAAVTPVFKVKHGKTYLLRLINAALNFQLFVGIAGHNLTLVEADAEYTEAYETQAVVLAPGQTSNVLVKADREEGGNYYIAVSVFSPANSTTVPFPTLPATALISYNSSLASASSAVDFSGLSLPSLPAYDDLAFVSNFTQSLRGQSYSRGYYYYTVPMKLDYDLLYTVGYSLQACDTCLQGYTLSASLNNQTFRTPTISVLQVSGQPRALQCYEHNHSLDSLVYL